MKWYKNRPDEGDLVVITINDVDKNSAYAELDEYEDVSGLIHISEVSRSWLQDVRKELSEGEKNVAQVIDSSEEGTIDLSLKRVNDNQKKETMARWKKEQKAERFIEDLAEKTGQDKEDLYEKVVFPMQKELGSAFHGFEIAVGEEEKLKQILEEDTVKAIQEISRDRINLRQEKLEGKLKIEFKQGNGAERLKQVLSKVNEDEGVEVKYVSAPEYSITTWGRNSSLAKKRINKAVDSIKQKVEGQDGEFEFSRA